jgi:lipopolysaccharide export system permease protein
VLREVLGPLAVGLLAILQLLVVVQLLQLNEIVFGSAVTLGDLLRVTAALAPHFLVVAVPLAFMLGVQLGIGRLSGDRELLALSASGINPLRLLKVPLAIALVLAACVAALAHWAEPWGLQQLNRVLNRIIKRNLESGLTPGVFNDGLPRFMIYVANQDGRAWNGVLIEDDVGDGAPLIALATHGEVADTAGEAMELRLRDGELHRMERDGETVARFREGSFLVGVQDPVARNNRFSQSEAQLPGATLRSRARELRAQHRPREAARLELELVRRWAVPFACLAFALLGVPLAVMATGARGTAYLITMGAFVTFYMLSRLSVALAEGGVNPWIAGFMPDLVIAAAGIPFLRQIVRHGVDYRR